MTVQEWEQDFYGDNVTITTRDQDCSIYRIRDASGDAVLTRFEIYPGIALVYNDVHTDYISIGETTDYGNVLEINHCREGRIEFESYEGEFLYVKKGDMAINMKAGVKEYSYFPQSHYHGVTIEIDFDEIEENPNIWIEELGLKPKELKDRFCGHNQCFVLHEKPEFERLFAELYLDLYHAIEKEYEENWFEDELSIDLPLLISRKLGIEPRLDRRDFTNIIMMFDYEHHDNWYSDEKILRMQKHFDNASEDGLLYVNYPMIESLYHFKEIPDTDYISRSIPVTCNPGKKYKELVTSESIIMDYLKLFDKINTWLRKKFSVSDDVIESFTYLLLSSKSLEELDCSIEKIASCIALDEKEKRNMKCTLLGMLSGYPFIKKSISYWNDLRDLFIYIFKENVNKSSFIQNIDGKEHFSVKEKYDEIEWNEVLKQQNGFSSDNESGIIFVLCTCITFLGEYKFCWEQD